MNVRALVAHIDAVAVDASGNGISLEDAVSQGIISEAACAAYWGFRFDPSALFPRELVLVQGHDQGERS